MKFWKRGMFFFIINVFSLKLLSQNLIENPSFEEYTSCPDNINQLNRCKGWWTTDNSSSPEYFNGCSMYNPYKVRVGVPKNFEGYRKAKEGNGYVGIALYGKNNFNYREYIQTKLLSKLNSGFTYRISAYVSLSDSSKILGDYLSFCFSDKKDLMTNIMNAPLCSCKDRIVFGEKNYFSKKEWILISSEFKATGKEVYLTVGSFKGDYSKSNFKKKANKYKRIGHGYRGNNDSSYLYIDNISLMCIDCEKVVKPKFR